MKDISIICSDATAKISAAEDSVTEALRKRLKHAGFPDEIANKYVANQVSSGEWILDDDRDLSQYDIQIRNTQQIVDVVKQIEEGTFYYS